MQIIQNIPDDLVNFLLLLLFSLLIGLEQRRRQYKKGMESFGSDRTFPLIAILGFVLYALDASHLTLFMGGGAVLSILLATFYYAKVRQGKNFGMTTIFIALITYCLTPLIYTQPNWLTISIVICVLVIVEIKEDLFRFSSRFDDNDFITLAKFLTMAGVLLPLLPDSQISTLINISPYRIWLAVVAVSALSYLSYLLQKFVFPKSGILLTGLLGGLYSSTATTVILARKGKEGGLPKMTGAAIIMATAMMYIRAYILAVIFNRKVAASLFIPILILVVVSLIISWYLQRTTNKSNLAGSGSVINNNPLEFKIALLFAFLFVLFSLATGYVVQQFGSQGIGRLSYIVGVTDIDPFLLNLFQGNYTSLTAEVIASATLTATVSNNVLKLIYSAALGGRKIAFNTLLGFGLLIVLSVLLVVWFY